MLITLKDYKKADEAERKRIYEAWLKSPLSGLQPASVPNFIGQYSNNFHVFTEQSLFGIVSLSQQQKNDFEVKVMRDNDRNSQNCRSNFRKYNKFLNDLVGGITLSDSTVEIGKRQKTIKGVKKSVKLTKDFKTTEGSKIPNDGLDALLLQFDSQEDFFRFGIKNIFYSNPHKVKSEWEELCKALENSRQGVIRHTHKKFEKNRAQAAKEYIKIQLEDGKDFSIKADPDGNSAVRKTFKELTGILASSGSQSNVTNYTLTHIWGGTSHPFTFSAPWNIALTSTFIAPLTDGKPTGHYVRTLFQSIFRAVAWELYSEILTWQRYVPIELHPDRQSRELAKSFIDQKLINVIE